MNKLSTLLEHQLERLLEGKWPLGTWTARRKTIAALKQLRAGEPANNKNERKIMKTLKRWWKKLCVGLAASAKERDITHGKINKFGGTGMKAAAVVALPLLIVAVPAKAQVGWDGDGARGRARGEPSNFVRSYTDYVTSRDGTHTLLDYLNGGDPYGANAIARSIEHAGATPDGSAMPGDQVFGSPIIMGPLSNSGSFRYCMPELSY